MPTTETIYYFGARNVPHRVSRVIPMTDHSIYVAQVYLVGPRGGESRAFVRTNGTCKKI